MPAGTSATADVRPPPMRRKPGGASIGIHGVGKRFDTGVQALSSIDLEIAGGEFVAIVGPSGCGKSTLLRIVAGLIPPSEGLCRRADKAMAAFVFQEAALLPWRDVTGNVELLMELERVAEPDRRRRGAQALAQVGLAGFEKAYPHELSGGMRMRLSLARAIALEPDLMLLDEPLAAVDELTRDVLQDELLALWRSIGFTALLVTHNVAEAVYLSNRVIVMSARPGRILGIIDVPFADERSPELRDTPEFTATCSRISRALRADRAHV